MRWPLQKIRGSVVLVAFCLIAVVGVGLAGYINACYQSLNHSTREYYNRQARYLAEVGLEEALWQLNNSMPWTGSGPASSTSWTGSNPKNLSITNYTLGSGATGQISVSVNTTTFAITSTATVSVANKAYTKTLTATTQRASAFPNAIASASGTVSFSTDGTVDSFNSSIAAYAAPSSSAGFAAIVAGNNVTLTNADVKGYVATYGTTPSYSGTATIKSFVSPASPNVDTTRVGKSAFIVLPTISYVTTGTTITGATSSMTGGNYRTTGNYTNSGPTTLLVTGGANRLYVAGNFSLSNTGRIQINAGASLEIFVQGNVSVTTTAANGFRNQSPTAAAPVPSNLALYTLGTGSFTWNTQRRFDGVIYATNASAATISVVNNNAVFYGAILSNNGITFSGSAPQIHYDSALRTANFGAINEPFVINLLTESATER